MSMNRQFLSLQTHYNPSSALRGCTEERADMFGLWRSSSNSNSLTSCFFCFFFTPPRVLENTATDTELGVKASVHTRHLWRASGGHNWGLFAPISKTFQRRRHNFKLYISQLTKLLNLDFNYLQLKYFIGKHFKTKVNLLRCNVMM